jgi:enoyl-CoA hydratase/carnithine racemase
VAYDEILYESADHVATVTLNRPDKLNAATFKLEHELRDALSAAEHDDDVRVIILTGAGRGFCAGADMKSLGDLAGTAATEAQLRERLADYMKGPQRDDARPDFQKTYSYFPAITKPIIAAVNGPAVGLGLVYAMYCDMRFASEQARFGTAFARRGLIAEHGISWMLPKLIGVANAMDLLLSARMIDSAEALRMGLVSRVLPAATMMNDVRAYALELANFSSPRSLRVIKRQVYETWFQTIGQAIDTANDEMIHSFGSDDFREGVAHFLEKRPPNFTGK